MQKEVKHQTTQRGFDRLHHLWTLGYSCSTLFSITWEWLKKFSMTLDSETTHQD